PRRDWLGLAFQTLVNGDFNSAEVAEFLAGAVPGLPGPVIAIWDRGPMHSGDPIRDVRGQSRGRREVEPVPAHRPGLMPVEQLWRWLKYDRLCNFTPRDARHLNEAVVQELEAI